jgi:putative ABC transport system substrate-binding protein
MRRREFLGLLGGLSATIISGAARGDAIKRVALVVWAVPVAKMQETSTNVYARTFFAELRRLGYVEGKNLIVLRFTSDDHAERIPNVAHEVVAATPDVILAFSSRVVLQLEKETTSIPIVFVIAGDPVANGIVASMSRPGGNATGLTSLNASADAKRFELLKEAIPALRRVALLTSRGDPATSSIASASQKAARSLGVELEIRNVESIDNLEGMLTAVVKAGSEAVIVAGSPVFFNLQPRIAQWAEAARTPAISPWRELPEAVVS